MSSLEAKIRAAVSKAKKANIKAPPGTPPGSLGNTPERFDRNQGSAPGDAAPAPAPAVASAASPGSASPNAYLNIAANLGLSSTDAERAASPKHAAASGSDSGTGGNKNAKALAARGTKPEAQRHAVRAGNGNAADSEAKLGPRARAQARAEARMRSKAKTGAGGTSGGKRAPSALEERLRRARDRGTSERTRAIERSGVAAVDRPHSGGKATQGGISGGNRASVSPARLQSLSPSRPRPRPASRSSSASPSGGGASPRRGVKPVRTPVDVRESRSPPPYDLEKIDLSGSPEASGSNDKGKQVATVTSARKTPSPRHKRQRSLREEAVEWARNLRTQPDSDGNPAFDAVSHTAKIAYFGASQFEQVRRKMQAAAYTVHGADVAGLFARFDRNCNGELSPEELHAAVTRIIPGVVEPAQLHRLIALMDLNGNGNVSVDEFAAFMQQSQHGENSMPTAAPTDLTHPPKLVTMETEAAAKRNARRAPAWQGKSLFPSQRARPRGVAGSQHRSAERLRALRSETDSTAMGGNSTPPPPQPLATNANDHAAVDAQGGGDAGANLEERAARYAAQLERRKTPVRRRTGASNSSADAERIENLEHEVSVLRMRLAQREMTVSVRDASASSVARQRRKRTHKRESATPPSLNELESSAQASQPALVPSQDIGSSQADAEAAQARALKAEAMVRALEAELAVIKGSSTGTASAGDDGPHESDAASPQRSPLPQAIATPGGMTVRSATLETEWAWSWEPELSILDPEPRAAAVALELRHFAAQVDPSMVGAAVAAAMHCCYPCASPRVQHELPTPALLTAFSQAVRVVRAVRALRAAQTAQARAETIPLSRLAEWLSSRQEQELTLNGNVACGSDANFDYVQVLERATASAVALATRFAGRHVALARRFLRRHGAAPLVALEPYSYERQRQAGQGRASRHAGAADSDSNHTGDAASHSGSAWGLRPVSPERAHLPRVWTLSQSQQKPKRRSLVAQPSSDSMEEDAWSEEEALFEKGTHCQVAMTALAASYIRALLCSLTHCSIPFIVPYPGVERLRHRVLALAYSCKQHRRSAARPASHSSTVAARPVWDPTQKPGTNYAPAMVSGAGTGSAAPRAASVNGRADPRALFRRYDSTTMGVLGPHDLHRMLKVCADGGAIPPIGPADEAFWSGNTSNEGADGERDAGRTVAWCGPAYSAEVPLRPGAFGRLFAHIDKRGRGAIEYDDFEQFLFGAGGDKTASRPIAVSDVGSTVQWIDSEARRELRALSVGLGDTEPLELPPLVLHRPATPMQPLTRDLSPPQPPAHACITLSPAQTHEDKDSGMQQVEVSLPQRALRRVLRLWCQRTVGTVFRSWASSTAAAAAADDVAEMGARQLIVTGVAARMLVLLAQRRMRLLGAAFRRWGWLHSASLQDEVMRLHHQLAEAKTEVQRVRRKMLSGASHFAPQLDVQGLQVENAGCTVNQVSLQHQ